MKKNNLSELIKKNKGILIFSCIYVIIALMLCIFINKGGYCSNEVSIWSPTLTSDGYGLSSDKYSIPASNVNVALTYTSNIDCDTYVMMEGAYIGAIATPLTGEGNYNVISIPCNVPWSTSDFTIRFDGANEGDVAISNLVITSDKSLNNDIRFKSVIAFITLLFILAIIVLVKLKMINTLNAIIISVLSFTVLFVSSPLMADVIYEGHDLLGLSGRIEGIKDAWACGQIFPVVMPNANNGYGYLEFMYPELFLLIPAFLRYINVSMVGALHFYIFLINICTAVFTYISVLSVLKYLSIDENYSSNKKTRIISLVSTLIYIFAQYRLADLYIRAAIGEAVAMAFLPLLIAGLYHLLAGNKKNWWMCVIGMTGVLQSHILSTAMFMPILVIFVLFYLSEIIKEKRFVEIIKAIIAFIILNAWFIIPFVRFYLFGLNTDALVINDPWNHTVLLSQLFSTTKGMATQDYFLRTLGISSLVVLIFVFIALFEHLSISSNVKSPLLRLLACVSTIFFVYLLLSLDITPYKWLYSLNEILNTVISMLQFPFRLLTVSSSCLVFMLAIALYSSNKLNEHIIPIAIGFAILGFVGSSALIDDYQSFTIGLTPISGGFCTHVPDDYLPAGIDKSILSDSNAYIDDGTIECTKRGTSVTLTYNAPSDTQASIPLLYYPCYKASLDDGSKITLINRDDKRIGLMLPAGEHTVTLKISLY